VTNPLGQLRTRLLLPLGLIAALVPTPASAQPSADGSTASAEPVRAERDGSRDFDFEFGEWKARIRRLEQPLTGSESWVEYEGTSIVRKVWNGKANLGELLVEGPAGRIEGMSLRLYDPTNDKWMIHWASSRDGAIGPAMIGGFQDGIGEFYNQELFNGRAVYVRFIFSDITPTSFRLEQAFSADGGKTWEPNWIATFEK